MWNADATRPASRVAVAVPRWGVRAVRAAVRETHREMSVARCVSLAPQRPCRLCPVRHTGAACDFPARQSAHTAVAITEVRDDALYRDHIDRVRLMKRNDVAPRSWRLLRACPGETQTEPDHAVGPPCAMWRVVFEWAAAGTPAAALRLVISGALEHRAIICRAKHKQPAAGTHTIWRAVHRPVSLA